MRSSFDFSPYRRSTVGFDRLFDFLETSGRSEPADNYPPFDLEKVSDDSYRITLAVAGFRAEEIDITARQNMLVVTGFAESEQLEGALGADVPILRKPFGIDALTVLVAQLLDRDSVPKA